MKPVRSKNKVAIADTELPKQGLSEANQFGKQVRAWRKEDGITQKELAAKSGMPLTAVRRCEQRGDIPLKRMLKLVNTLGGEFLTARTPAISPFKQENDYWHTNIRKKDREDIAKGISKEEINQRNAFIPNPQEWVLVDLGETIERCYEEEI